MDAFGIPSTSIEFLHPVVHGILWLSMELHAYTCNSRDSSKEVHRPIDIRPWNSMDIHGIFMNITRDMYMNFHRYARNPVDTQAIPRISM